MGFFKNIILCIKKKSDIKQKRGNLDNHLSEEEEKELFEILEKYMEFKRNNYGESKKE